MVNRHTTFYVDKVSELSFCGNPIWQVEGGTYEKPFQTEPTKGEHDYNNCKNCQQLLKNITKQLIERMEGNENKKGFPFCCPEHSNLIKLKEFDACSFVKVPEMVANKVIYTNQHILNTHKAKDYYKDITDYISYTVESFGSTPTNFGEPLFLGFYFSCIRDHIKRNMEDLTNEKAAKILEFLDSYYIKADKAQTDLNILLGTYQKWLKIFPFELSYFKNFKAYYEKTLPLLNGKPEVNIYTKVAKAKMHTKSSLIDVLLILTNTLLSQINSLALYEKRLLTEPQKLKLELVLSERKMKLKQGYINNSVNEEQRYRKILKEWFADEKAFINSVIPIMKTIPPQQPKQDKEPNRLQMIKDEVITDRWANGDIAQIRYNSKQIWHQLAGYHYERGMLNKNHSDSILDTVNFPIITKGLTAYLIQNLGKSEQLIFDKYYENCLNSFQYIETKKPGSSMRNLDTEFYPIHLSQEKEFAKFSEQIHPYLNQAEIELINQYIVAYFGYIKQVYSSKGSTEKASSKKQVTENECSVPDWCIIFYYLDEVGTGEGAKIDRIEKFIIDNNIRNSKGELTTKGYFKKEYHKIRGRINQSENSKGEKLPLLPPKRIEKILPFIKKNKKALQSANNDIVYLTNESNENE